MPKPTIFVPGLPGSHLLDRDTEKKLFLNIPAILSPSRKKEILRRLRGPDDLVAGDDVVAGKPIRRVAKLLFFDLAKQADSLYDILRGIGSEPAKFGWDWRRPVYDRPMLERLEEAIVRLHRTTGKQVVVIVHSTGGLVIRRLLEEQSGNSGFLSRIERVIAFGVPWAGLPKPFLYLDGERSFGLGLINRRQARDLLGHSWAAFDLLPPDPAKTDMTDQTGTPLNMVVDGNGRQVSPLIKRDWFHPDLKRPMDLRADAADRELGRRSATLELGIPVTNVVGWGTETTFRAQITGSGSRQSVEFFDGKGDATLDGGDGTIPRVSAAWLRGPEVNTYHVPVGIVPRATKHPHSTLWRNPGGRNLLRHFVGGKPLAPFLYATVDDSDFFSGDTVRVRVVALDAGGQPLADARVKTRDLSGGQQIEQAFDSAREGRHLMRIPRARIRPVSNHLRRFQVEIRGQDGDDTRIRHQSFFLRR